MAGLVSIPCMLEKDYNGNPISTFPPCSEFQMIFTALAPRLIQSISRNVHNKNRALKQLCALVKGGNGGGGGTLGPGKIFQNSYQVNVSLLHDWYTPQLI